MHGFKMQTPMKYQHFAFAHPIDKRPFPIHLFGVFGCCPHMEEDSNFINNGQHGVYAPVFLTSFSAYPDFRYNKADLQMWNNCGWEVTPITAWLNKATVTWSRFHAAIVKPIRGYQFPVDMLRYDQCYPYNEQEGRLVEEMVYDPQMEMKAVRVVQPGSTRNPTWREDRWDSFGWKIEPISYVNLLRND